MISVEDLKSESGLMKKNNDRAAAGYESIRQFFSKRINIINLLAIPLIAYTVFLLYRIISASFTNIAIPNEYREAANIELTKAFIHGINPYSLEGLKADTPGIVYVYGPLYSLVTAFVSMFVHIDLIVLHYIVTLISMLVAAVLTAEMIREHTRTVTAPAAGFLFVIICTWRYGYINAVPDSFALMLFILTIFIETRKFKNKEIISALLTVAIFFTKQYFVIIFPIILVYTFISDKDSFKRYALYTALSGAIAVLAVSITCPLYWTYTIYFAHGPWGLTHEQINDAFGKSESSLADTTADAAAAVNAALSASAENTDPKTGFGYEILQLRTLAGTFLFIFAGAALGIIDALKKHFCNISDFMKFLIINIVISSAALIYLGRNDGAWLSYYLQLLMPSVIMLSVIYTENAILSAADKMRKYAYMLLFVLMLFFTIFRTDRRLSVYNLSEQERASWEEAYSILNTYCKKGEVYYSPLLAFNAISNDQYFYNNGHSMVITGWFKGEWEALKWEQKLFPYADEVMTENCKYQDKIIEKAADGEYSLITCIVGMDDDKGRMGADEISQGPYEQIAIITLRAGRMSYDVQFWAKKNP